MDHQIGYWKVLLSPSYHEKTAFSIETGLWQFTVMPFEFSNTPATVERLMELVGLLWGFFGGYLFSISGLHHCTGGPWKTICEILKRSSRDCERPTWVLILGNVSLKKKGKISLSCSIWWRGLARPTKKIEYGQSPRTHKRYEVSSSFVRTTGNMFLVSPL